MSPIALTAPNSANRVELLSSELQPFSRVLRWGITANLFLKWRNWERLEITGTHIIRLVLEQFPLKMPKAASGDFLQLELEIEPIRRRRAEKHTETYCWFMESIKVQSPSITSTFIKHKVRLTLTTFSGLWHDCAQWSVLPLWRARGDSCHAGSFYKNRWWQIVTPADSHACLSKGWTWKADRKRSYSPTHDNTGL